MVKIETNLNSSINHINTLSTDDQALLKTFKESIHSSFEFHNSTAAAKLTYQNPSGIESSSSKTGNSSNSQIIIHPLIQFLKENNNKQKGWLRKVLNHQSIHQSGQKKRIKYLLTVTSILSSFGSNNSSFAAAWPQMVNHTFGTSKNRISTLQSNFISQEFSLERKQREDKGSSLIHPRKESQYSLHITIIKSKSTKNSDWILEDFHRLT